MNLPMKKILLIEDNTNVLSNITKILQSEGFFVIAADNGLLGLKMAQQHLPRLIICDIMLPEMDGYEVLKALRQDPATGTIPFIFLTAKSDKSDFRQGMELGSDDYLTKPFTRDELLGAISAQFKKQESISHYYRQELDNLRSNISQSLPHQLLFPSIEVVGLADILLKNCHAMELNEISDIGKRIRKAGRDMHNMVKKFLLYAELESIEADENWVRQLRNNKTTFVEIEIKNMALEVANQYNRATDLELDLEDATVRISDSYLGVIVKELVDNAFKFSSEGVSVHVRGVVSEDSFRLTIKDGGRGMATEELSQLGAYMKFEKKLYSQQGTGLGLAIVKRLVQLHGGQFNLSSELYEYTLVEVVLPLFSLIS
ncbi:MAG: response regulator [Pseudanabaenaceae cyanobacterium]|jgi:CheY-like chemotaxis protein/anti-sigma regulatory factor (Ser/Thr protein kinase)